MARTRRRPQADDIRPDHHQPADWNRLQARIKENARRGGGVRKVPGTLAGIAFCAQCGRVLHYRINPGKNNTDYAWTGYRCDGTSKNPSRCRNTISAAALEAAVDKMMIVENGRFGHLPVTKVTMRAAHDYEDEIEDVQRSLMPWIGAAIRAGPVSARPTCPKRSNG